MAKLRPAKCYRKVKRAYTRKSKYRKYSFVRSVPAKKVVKFDQGNLKKEFESSVNIVSKEAMQIRQNALESARIKINRAISKRMGNNYHLKLRIYPHHVLRENKMLTGAGADRMQSGMQRAFGKPMGLAAQVKKNQKIFTLGVDKKDVNAAKKILKSSLSRLPGKYSVV